MSRIMRRNCRNIEPADTIILLRTDLNRLLSFVEQVAKGKNNTLEALQIRAIKILQEDDKLEEWQKGLYQQ